MSRRRFAVSLTACLLLFGVTGIAAGESSTTADAPDITRDQLPPVTSAAISDDALAMLNSSAFRQVRDAWASDPKILSAIDFELGWSSDL